MRRYLSHLRYVCRPEDELGKSYKPLSINVFKAQGVDFELYEVSSNKVYLPDGKEYDPETDDIHTDEPDTEDQDVRLLN
jgi:hypothetical protein